MAGHFDPITLEIDHAAIRASAEEYARIKVAGNAEMAAHWRFWGATPPEPWAYAEAYAFGHRQMLSSAECHVDARKFVREQAELRAAMTPREREIEQLREIAHLAPMIDDTPKALAEQEAAERELAELMSEPV